MMKFLMMTISIIRYDDDIYYVTMTTIDVVALYSRYIFCIYNLSKIPLLYYSRAGTNTRLSRQVYIEKKTSL